MSDPRTPVQLVVVGSSAGGIEALSTLVATLPAPFPAPIVIAQHLGPTRPSHLGTILGRCSALPVITVRDHVPLCPGTVYVVPSNTHIQIADHDVTVLPDGPEGPKPSVDLLLSSAAEIFGEHLIAVILTGTGTDGTAGARAVKQAGGTVVIQNPATAAYPGMPQSLAPQTVDIVADLARIGPILQNLLSGVAVPARPAGEQALQALLEQVHARSGIDFSAYKPATIRRRLQHRIVATDTSDLAGYRAFLAAHPEEYQRLVTSFLIKVTEFMRDPEFFALLREEVLPELIAHSRSHGNELRIWSAGCATGEEAYSLAILVCEVLGEELARFTVKVFATDLDADAIVFARRGLYPAAALAGLPDELLARYFTTSGGSYEIKKQLRSLVVFGEHDLGRRAAFPRIDLVLCRNVLIYFANELQQRALHLFAFALREGGYLALGRFETVNPLAEFFTVQHTQHNIYRRAGRRLPVLPLPMAMPLREQPSEQIPRRVAARDLFRAQQDLKQSRTPQENLLLNLPIGVVVVDQHYDIQEINRAARRLLGIHAQAVGEDFVHLAQHVAPRPLRSAIDRALRDKTVARLDVVEVPHVITGEPTFLQLDCYPQTDVDDGPASHALILVTDITATLQSRQEIEQAHAHQAALATQLEQSVHDLERANADLVDGNAALQQSNAALEGARRAAEEVAGRQARQMEHLVESNRLLLAANEELTRRNAELRATRDAFLLSGEGAQAAIEEVATLNEEMQATNEELETLNEELQATIEELNMSNADLAARGAELQGLAAALQAQHQRSEREREQLAAILANMADAVLVVTPLGTPLLTNTAYMELFGSGDVVLRDEMGRPLSSAATPQMRAAQGETFSMTFICTTADGNRHWYEAIGQPVRGQGGLAWGVVVIRDITERSLRHLQEEFLALANHELRGPLAVIQGYLDLLASDLTDGAEGERLLRYASAARAQAKRLTRLVNDLRDVTRLERGKFSLRFAPVCLDTLLREAVEKGQTLPCDQTIMLSADRQVMVNGDAERLQQAVLNLLSNAVAHAAGSERIDVRLRCVDDVAEMEVQDYGAGITAEHLPDLFSRFYQVSHDQPVTRPGLGLELYIAQQIVAGHGGTITVASTEGEGTSFTVRLPLSVE